MLENNIIPPSSDIPKQEYPKSIPVKVFLLLLNPFVWFGSIFALFLLALILFPQAHLFNTYLYQSENVSFDKTYGYAFANNKTDQYWEIEYEIHSHETFSGTVGKIISIRERFFPLLTHDILLTNGNFSDQQKVSSSVFNHHFSWRSKTNKVPQGTINLLHTIPANNEILGQLIQLNTDNKVVIEGYEILAVRYWRDKSLVATWQDTGCNTLLVTSVQNQDGNSK